MNIPQLTKDLAVIQKLSDLPNAADGLSAAELKAKFDEAGLAIQRWLNESLVPALKAENIPFSATNQLPVENIQAAIQLVFEQVRGASSGTITNGSVTKVKLAEELLERVFGGKVWVSLDRPTEADTPQREFPVGQMWLRPDFTVVNAAGNGWTSSACSVETEENKMTVTGSGAAMEASIGQALANIGQDGDRVFVLFSVKDKDGEIISLKFLLGGEEFPAENGVYETTLTGGSLSLGFRAVWPSVSLADGSFTIENLAVVNVDEILRQVNGAKDVENWGAYLETLLPIGSFRSPRELYVQTEPGIWQQFDFEVFPAERGGTGLDKLEAGEMLYGSGESKMKRLSAAETEHSLLQFAEGKPQWKTADEVAASTGILRGNETTYTGTGVDRDMELPGKPLVLWIRVDDKVHRLFQGTKVSGNYTGSYKMETAISTNVYETTYTASVLLEGNLLKFRFEDPYGGESRPQYPEGGSGNTGKPITGGDTGTASTETGAETGTETDTGAESGNSFKVEWITGGAVHLNETDKAYTLTVIY